MIKFFRQIRQQLLSEGKSVNYLKYAIGEIVLVVIGILIALQINNWNEKQKLDSKTQDYYLQLLDDLNSDILFAKTTIKDFSNYLKEYEAYTNTFINELLTPILVYEQLSKLPVITIPLTFNSSTLESLQNSGDIGLIHSKIRNRLIDLKRLQNLILTRYDYTQNGKSGLIQNLNPLLGSTTLPQRLKNQPEMKNFLNINENLKELILVYEGIHRWKSVSEQEAIVRLEEMQKEIDTIIKLINKELNK